MTDIQNLSQREVELLSAYVDGQLPDRQAQQLETRLRQDSELFRALKDIEATSRLLRALPVVKAPRSFTLTPEIAGVYARRSWTSLLWPMATAAAALAFVVVAGLDALTGGGFGIASAPVLDQAALLAPEESIGADLAAQVPAEPAAGAAFDGELPTVEEEMLAEEGAAADRAQESESAEEGSTPTPLAAAEDVLAPESEAQGNLEMEELSSTASPTAVLRPSLVPEQSFADDGDIVELEFRPEPSRVSSFRWLQALFAGLTFLLLIVTFISRRRAR